MHSKQVYSKQQYSVFVGDQHHTAGGNSCMVVACDSAASSIAINSLANVTQTTHCYSWPTNTPAQFLVQCYQGENKIECCGHGLLATANYYVELNDYTEINLFMGDTSVRTYQSKGITWLSFPRVNCQLLAIPDWFELLYPPAECPCRPIFYAIAGGGYDYQIFQWPDNFPLKSLAQPGSKLSKYSQRAVIFTAKQSSDAYSDIHFRYFAPQYGVKEDTATGSAMRILIDYWSVEFTHLTAIQCSSKGGVLFGSVAEYKVDIGGRSEKLIG